MICATAGLNHGYGWCLETPWNHHSGPPALLKFFKVWDGSRKHISCLRMDALRAADGRGIGVQRSKGMTALNKPKSGNH